MVVIFFLYLITFILLIHIDLLLVIMYDNQRFWRGSSVGKSEALITLRSWVRIPPPLPSHRWTSSLRISSFHSELLCSTQSTIPLNSTLASPCQWQDSAQCRAFYFNIINNIQNKFKSAQV